MDGIIFDVDGTLWDSTDAVADAWNLAIRENSSLELELDGPGLKKLFGKTMNEISLSLFPELTESDRNRLGDLCYEYENRMLLTHPGRLYEGIEECIRQLSKRYPLYIVSNCQCGYIEVFLQSTGLGAYFQDHLCFGDTGLPKGKTIRRLMEKHGIKSAVYVGDTQTDADACREAGIPIVYAAYGFGTVKNPNYQIDSPGELAGLF